MPKPVDFDWHKMPVARENNGPRSSGVGDPRRAQRRIRLLVWYAGDRLGGIVVDRLAVVWVLLR